MLQMYVGMPWARTVMQATTAQKETTQEAADAARAVFEAKARIDAARQRLERDLDEARRSLAALPDEVGSAERLERLADEVARLSQALPELDSRLAQAEVDAAQLRTVADEDERSLRDLRENAIAVRFFNGLSPSCCPRCETAIGQERLRREAVILRCSLCSESITEERTEESPDLIEEAEQRRAASAAAADRAEAAVSPLRSERERIAAQLVTAQRALTVEASGGAFRRRRDAELAVARIEGALRDRSYEKPPAAPSADEAVVTAALAEAKSEFEAARGDLLTALDDEILRLGRAFGIAGLEEVDLNSNAVMRIQKGGQATSFSHLTAGERLRLRIATVVALLRVGRARGVGRHPGLIIIDSPGAEETSEHDLEGLLRELRVVAQEIPELQVLVASANATAVEAILGAGHCRIAPAGGYLW
jgi:hypothetical protein